MSATAIAESCTFESADRVLDDRGLELVGTPTETDDMAESGAAPSMDAAEPVEFGPASGTPM